MKNIYIVVLLSLVVLFNGCKEDFLEGWNDAKKNK